MAEVEPIALFDMDGTICDYTGSMLARLEALRSPQEPFIDPFALGDTSDEQYNYLWRRMDLIKSQVSFWAQLPIVTLGLDVLELAKNMGYHCEILTQAPKAFPAALAGKREWLLAHEETRDLDFAMVRNKSRHYGRVLVDDYPGYIEPWLAVRERGLVIMPATDYNRDFSHDRVVRYDSTNLEIVADRLADAMNP